jgi:hypothetical protein
VYALGANNLPPYTDADFSAFVDAGRYERNDTEQTAAVITEGSMMAYLHKNDIDYYHFQVPEPESEPEPEAVFIPHGLSLDASLAWLHENALEDCAYTITLRGDETIAPKSLSYSWKTVSVTLNGGAAERTVSLSSNGSLFTVASGVTLTLDNNVILQGRSGNNAALVKVNSGGKLVMKTGSKISGNSNYYDGGGVYVGGTFTMSGGTISGNSSSSSNGGGVLMSSGTFTMSGGTISGNSAFDDGGGVCVWGENTFTKQAGGTIYGSNAEAALRNTAGSDSHGHAVYVSTSSSKKRNTTAWEGVTLDSRVSGPAGGWE